MFKIFSTFDNILKALIRLVILAAVGAGGWMGYQAYSSSRHASDLEKQLAGKVSEIEALNAKVAQIARQNELLQMANRLLKVDRRVAEINVIKQTGSAADGTLATTFTFVEVDADDRPIAAARTYMVHGDVAYIDSWVIKYDDKLVETADPLRATSVCLFRRIFGESQAPKDGFPIDAVNARPDAYGAGRPPSALERDIWSNFWKYANDPVLARQAGVRVLQGEAPSTRLMPGKRYRVSLRASGGLEITPKDGPRKDVGQAFQPDLRELPALESNVRQESPTYCEL